MTILLFLAVLFVLILVHELGHFAVAKWTGMRVDEFGIGFPPRLFGWRKGETLYSLNALPIGGFVKIFGEDFEAEKGGESTGRAFTQKSRWAQATVLIAGVTMNVLFAWVLFAAVLMIGVPTQVSEETANDDAQLVVAEVIAESPAAEAGIPAGARIASLHVGDDELTVPTPSSVAAFTQAHADEMITVTYSVRGEEVSTTLTPRAGVINESPQPAMGVQLALIETVRYPIHTALYNATETTISSLVAITVGISNLLADAVTLSADLSGVAGPVGIVGLVGDAADFGITSLLMFTAIISLNLAIINLLPFPALDGGRLLFVAIEAVTRRPLNPVWAARANFVGFALLMLLMVAVTYNDILRIV